MFTTRFSPPKVTLLRRRSLGTYEVVEAFRTVHACLNYVRLNDLKGQLYVVEYVGRNVYVVSEVQKSKYATVRKQLELF